MSLDIDNPLSSPLKAAACHMLTLSVDGRGKPAFTIFSTSRMGAMLE